MITLIQSVTGVSTASPTTAAFANNNSFGKAIIICIAVTPSTATFAAAPTDTQGNTYNQLGTAIDATSNTLVGIYYAANIKSGANTVSVTTATSPTAICIDAREYLGVPHLGNTGIRNPSGTATNAGSGTAVANTSFLTTTQNGNLILSMVTNNSTNTYTAGAGFGNLDSAVQGTLELAVEDLSQSQAAGIKGTFTQSSTANWQVLTIGIMSHLANLGNNYNFTPVGDGMSRSEIAN